MAPHVFVLRDVRGVPPTTAIRALNLRFGHGMVGDRYKTIEDDDVAAKLREYERDGTKYFRWLTADELEEALDTAEGAVDAIAAGEYDDDLDLLLFAEREVYDGRITVINAIDERRQELIEQRRAESGDSEVGLSPTDVAPGFLG